MKKSEKRLDYIKSSNEDYTIVIARHERFHWMAKDSSEYVYFIYITRKQKRFIDKGSALVKEYNVLCFNNMYTSFYNLMISIYPILEEYILDSKKIVEIVMLVEKLNDVHVERSGKKLD